MSESVLVAAFDPGEQTGWAYAHVDDNGLHNLSFGYDPWKVVAARVLNRQLGDNPFEVVVYESFRLRAPNAKQLVGSDFQTPQCIGALKVAAWHSGALLVTSEPSNKPVIDAAMGGPEQYLPKRHQVEHYRDAVRHLYWYALFKLGVPYEKLIGGKRV